MAARRWKIGARDTRSSSSRLDHPREAPASRGTSQNFDLADGPPERHQFRGQSRLCTAELCQHRRDVGSSAAAGWWRLVAIGAARCIRGGPDDRSRTTAAGPPAARRHVFVRLAASSRVNPVATAWLLQTPGHLADGPAATLSPALSCGDDRSRTHDPLLAKCDPAFMKCTEPYQSGRFDTRALAYIAPVASTVATAVILFWKPT
jgi:hypothetical protein